MLRPGMELTSAGTPSKLELFSGSSSDWATLAGANVATLDKHLAKWSWDNLKAVENCLNSQLERAVRKLIFVREMVTNKRLYPFIFIVSFQAGFKLRSLQGPQGLQVLKQGHRFPKNLTKWKLLWTKSTKGFMKVEPSQVVSNFNLKYILTETFFESLDGNSTSDLFKLRRTFLIEEKKLKPGKLIFDLWPTFHKWLIAAKFNWKFCPHQSFSFPTNFELVVTTFRGTLWLENFLR